MNPNRGIECLLVVVGPTGVGKTATGMAIARHIGGEIVSADSRQIYRLMDIGTAKPSPHDLRAVRHHLVNIIDPDQTLSVSEFQKLASAAFADIHARQGIPLLVGGTGQYVTAVVERWAIPVVPPQYPLRLDLESIADVYGHHVLHQMLAQDDPEAARKIDPRNIRRVVRALEVRKGQRSPVKGDPDSAKQDFRILQIGLTRERKTLYQVIDDRVDRMLSDGLLDEIRELLARGYEWGLPALSAVGYIQFRGYLAGLESFEDAVRSVKRETRRYIRQQYNWFRLDDPRIHWFDLDQVQLDEIISFGQSWIERNC